MYTVKEIAQLAGVTKRTIRYYDEINLLKPASINHSGYRIYTSNEVTKLQEIMFLRALDMSIQDIKAHLDNPYYNRLHTLYYQRDQLKYKRDQLEILLTTINKSILNYKGDLSMKDEEKFIGLKSAHIKENEALYGKEARRRYGDEQMDLSNKKFMAMHKEEFDKYNALTKEFNEKLKLAVTLNDVESELATEVCLLHKKWLMHYWQDYSKEAHLALANMYVEDTRFTMYYENICENGARFLKAALQHFLKA